MVRLHRYGQDTKKNDGSSIYDPVAPPDLFYPERAVRQRQMRYTMTQEMLSIAVAQLLFTTFLQFLVISGKWRFVRKNKKEPAINWPQLASLEYFQTYLLSAFWKAHKPTKLSSVHICTKQAWKLYRDHLKESRNAIWAY